MKSYSSADISKPKSRLFGKKSSAFFIVSNCFLWTYEFPGSPGIWNGEAPAAISYIRIPNDHQSTWKEYRASYTKISGARYSGVPANV